VLNKNSKYNDRKTYTLSSVTNKNSKYRFRDPDVKYPNHHLNVLEWLQNPKVILDQYQDVFYQYLSDYKSTPEEEIYFLSNDTKNIFSNAKVVKKNSFMAKDKDLYINRGKDSVVLILGDEWSAGDGLIQNGIKIDLANDQDILDYRLQNIYGSKIASFFDSDLYLSTQVYEPNNTDLVFSLPAILEFLQEKNYRTIKVVFQMSSPDRCMFWSQLWHSKLINNRYGRFYEPYNDDEESVIGNYPNSVTPWAYFFWHLGVQRKDILNNTWHIMDYWPYGFFSYEDYFRYYDLCILECFDAFCDQYTNIEPLCFKKNSHWRDNDIDFSSVKIIEKPWLQEILEYHGHNIDLTQCYNDQYINNLKSLFVVSPFEILNTENMMAREKGYLRDMENKKKLIIDTMHSIEDNEHFYKGWPQKHCHSKWAQYIIDRSKWRM